MLRQTKDQPHPRSCNPVLLSYTEVIDGGIGHGQGLLVDEERRATRQPVVSTGIGWIGFEVPVARRWIRRVLRDGTGPRTQAALPRAA